VRRPRLTTSGELGRGDCRYPASSSASERGHDFLRRVIDLGNAVHFSDGHLSRRHKEMIATTSFISPAARNVSTSSGVDR
jgi:hypothetical protein